MSTTFDGPVSGLASECPPTPDDPRLLALVQEYLAELEAGCRPDRLAFLARCPELADALGPCLEGLEAVHAVARPRPSLDATTPPSESPPADLNEHPPVNPLGDFWLRRELGAGGMGVVYEAVQLSLGRAVAVKVLPAASALDARALRRFKTEAHAAALLSHPHIVPVHAVGCEQGVHFFAMRLVEGRTLDEVIEQQHLAETPRGAAFFRKAARWMMQAAEALGHAHEQGVVHRDVKPGNLLIDGDDHLWVADFGLAQLHAENGLTQTGDVLGTLRYMSPEQASGKHGPADPRSDVYSLGATFYELLTLRPLCPAEDKVSLVRQLLREEPRPPRAVDRAVPEDLDKIVLKAIAKEPAERYATAQELADDLRRFLDDRPVLARRPTLLDRGRKWLKRHPGWVAGGLLLLLLSTAALVVSNALIAREQGHTREALRRERERAEEAERRFRQARRAADLLLRVCEEDLATSPRMIGLRQRLLEAALETYQDFLDQPLDDPATREELAASKARAEQTLRDLTVLRGSERVLLLADPAVVEAIRPTAAQREKLKGLSQRLTQRPLEVLRESRGLPEAERQKHFLAMAAENEQAAAEVLTPDQMRRLGQIALQRQGLFAFRDPAVIDALGLTAAQRDGIRAAESEAMTSAWAALTSRDENTGRLQERAWKEAGEKVRALLSEEQRGRWDEMVGEPFEGASRTRTPRFP